MRILATAIVLALCASWASPAQAQVETVVVTGERMSDENQAPHLSMVKRADHLITHVTVTCDTRDATTRKSELITTLKNMIHAAAGTPTISLGTGDGIVYDLNENKLDDIISADSRPDTSRATLIIKTKISPADTIDGATGRIKDFVARTTKVGRTEVYPPTSFDLTLVGPEQYHDQIVAMIVTDAKHIADAFGPGYGVHMEGLEHQVSWYQKGPLDLGLYISYSMRIDPLR